ncbi:hypothetical protein J2X55_002401 [Microbacterium sp. 1154]|uniref:hypothetical protein n=1 Tax=Microbacterium sp. 1154 TaxID=2817733 RepID=UPI002864848A|nr:hypothetical protein [Microbacterium sp. 1154]MDR6691478.1 hypothetical protein [Microbacterium sp. 1154]
MTDEQVQQIVDALAGDPAEPWVTAAVAVVSVVLGFVLSQVSEMFTRKRARADKEAEARAEAVKSATTIAVRSMSTPAELKHDVEAEIVEVTREVIALHAIEATGEVGNWWFRQMMRANSVVPEDRPYTEEESAFRAAVGASVLFRLNAWRDGQIPADDFRDQGDAAWDRERFIPPTPKFFLESEGEAPTD